MQLKPGAAALLSWLKTEGVAVVLATSSVRERAVEVLTRLGVVQYFDDMVFGTEIERGKPWPGYFPEGCRKSPRPPRRTVWFWRTARPASRPPTPRASTSSACPI